VRDTHEGEAKSEEASKSIRPRRRDRFVPFLVKISSLADHTILLQAQRIHRVVLSSRKGEGARSANGLGTKGRKEDRSATTHDGLFDSFPV